jgi:hypothetical protein
LIVWLFSKEDRDPANLAPAPLPGRSNLARRRND